MSLYDLRKKIQELQTKHYHQSFARDNVWDAYDDCLDEIKSFEKELSSRVSQLEKENNILKSSRERKVWLSGKIDELRGVLGENS